MRKKSVLILMGGWSSERQVSLDKTPDIQAALIKHGYDVRCVDVKRDLESLLNALDPRPDVVFNNLYGTGGEDGTIQAVLDMLEIPYTHSGLAASAIGMDKILTRYVAQSIGIPMAPCEIVKGYEFEERTIMPIPFVAKIANNGSSVGVHVILNEDHYSAFKPEPNATYIVEEYIAGLELAVAIYQGKAQGVTNIITDHQWFDYEAKYKDANTKYELPAQIPAAVYESALEHAESLFQAIGCHGIARCDFRFDPARGMDGLFLLEINTQPGFSAASLAPQQVIYNGVSFEKLCAELVEDAR
jgi:D-alanine-D-alanine ligase